MKPLLLFLLVSLLSCKAKNVITSTNKLQPEKEVNYLKKDSCIYYYDDTLKVDVYTLSDESPEYIGGFSKFNAYITDNVQIKDQYYVQGSFKVTFIIDLNGKVLRDKNIKTIPTEQEKELMRVVELSPNWKPAKCNGKTVYFKIIIPIHWNKH